MRCLFLVSPLPALCLLAALYASEPAPPTAPAPDRAAGEIATLIRQLGDQNFEVRQAATERLMQRPDAAPALRQALKSSDLEVVRRAESILDAFARRRDKEALARLADLAKNGEVDQVIELLVRQPKWADEDVAWQVITGLADRLIDLADKEFGKPTIPERKPGFPAGDFRRYAEYVEPELRPPKSQVSGRVVDIFFRRWERALVRAEEIEAGKCISDLLVSAGAIRNGGDKMARTCWLVHCAVFAGGSVEVLTASNSVIICDGDFSARDGASNCLIVTRGNVWYTDRARSCRIIASGSVSLPKAPGETNTQVKEKEPNPLGFVKWFEPSSVGVVVEAAEGGLRLKEATEGKPFARAGLKSGDLAVSADGKAIGSAEDFRRLLRRKVVMQEDLPLEVRRDGQLLKLLVPLKQ